MGSSKKLKGNICLLQHMVKAALVIKSVYKVKMIKNYLVSNDNFLTCFTEFISGLKAKLIIDF